MGVVGGGAQATLALIDEAHALPVPDSLPWPEAGGFPEAFSTAFDALFTRGQLAMGERVLISGAAGGVGTAAVQLAAAAGATVVATVRDQARHADVTALGATIVIDPDAVADHGPYDEVLELVGAPSLTSALPHMATEGRAVVIGVGAGSKMELNLFQLMMPRIRIGGATLRARTRAEKANVARAVTRHVLPLLEAGRIRVPVCDTYPMADADTAYERFGTGKKFGKVVLVHGA
jgi:NADPH:quinone reductase-like Zn-dependent oxidoreductase